MGFRRSRVIPMILGEIKRYLRDGNSLRVSRSIRDTAYRILKAREKIEAQDEEATIARIAEELELKEREVVYALDAISDPVSLYDPVYNKSGRPAGGDRAPRRARKKDPAASLL